MCLHTENAYMCALVLQLCNTLETDRYPQVCFQMISQKLYEALC